MGRNFENLIDAYLDYSSGHESTVRVRKWCIISVIAAALERRVSISRGYFPLFPNLYTFIIGRSGLIKKTTSTGIAVNLLREISDIRIMSERLTSSALVEQLAMAGKQYEINGQTMKQSALFAYASELAVFLEEVYGDITTLLTTFYDGIPHDCNKPWVYGSIMRGDRKIYGPCLNILGASTKAWLTKCIPRSEIEGGFTSRIVFVVENNLPDVLIAWPEYNEDREIQKLKLVEDLREIHSLCGVYEPDKYAKGKFTKWYQMHMTTVLPQNQDPLMVGYMSRKGDTILKLSMIRAASQRDELVITCKDLDWAIDEIDDLEKDWRLAFDNVGLKTGVAYEMKKMVSARRFVKKRELVDFFTGKAPMVEIMKAIAELKDMDEMIETHINHNGTLHTFFVVPGSEYMIVP